MIMSISFIVDRLRAVTDRTPANLLKITSSVINEIKTKTATKKVSRKWTPQMTPRRL